MKYHEATRLERLEQAIIPLVNRGCTAFEIYDIIVKASIAFRQGTGITFREFRRTLRLSLAQSSGKSMMVRTNTIVKEIRRMVRATMFFSQEKPWLVANIAIARIEAKQ